MLIPLTAAMALYQHQFEQVRDAQADALLLERTYYIESDIRDSFLTAATTDKISTYPDEMREDIAQNLDNWEQNIERSYKQYGVDVDASFGSMDSMGNWYESHNFAEMGTRFAIVEGKCVPVGVAHKATALISVNTRSEKATLSSGSIIGCLPLPPFSIPPTAYAGASIHLEGLSANVTLPEKLSWPYGGGYWETVR